MAIERPPSSPSASPLRCPRGVARLSLQSPYTLVTTLHRSSALPLPRSRAAAHGVPKVPARRGRITSRERPRRLAQSSNRLPRHPRLSLAVLGASACMQREKCSIWAGCPTSPFRPSWSRRQGEGMCTCRSSRCSMARHYRTFSTGSGGDIRVRRATVGGTHSRCIRTRRIRRGNPYGPPFTSPDFGVHVRARSTDPRCASSWGLPSGHRKTTRWKRRP